MSVVSTLAISMTLALKTPLATYTDSTEGMVGLATVTGALTGLTAYILSTNGLVLSQFYVSKGEKLGWIRKWVAAVAGIGGFLWKLRELDSRTY